MKTKFFLRSLAAVLIVSNAVFCTAHAATAEAEAEPKETPAPADVQTKKTEPAKNSPPVKTYSVVQSDQNLAGTRLSYPVRVYAKINETNKTVCIPAGFPLRGLGLVTDQGAPVKLRALNQERFDKDAALYKLCDDDELKDGETMTPLKDAIGAPLIIEQRTNAMYTATSNGLTYGALFVPFKYQLGGSKDFKGAVSVGPYAGYKLESANWAAGLEMVGFAGLGMVKGERIKDGKPITEEIAAFSYGGALIGRIKRDIQIGLVLGQDRASKSSQYKDQGKWWLALSIGFPFSN
ncbi:hypothetical protein HF313_14145 [Massilia atriviolacea]|uniref:Uncharacterized protein n=1 Tax=Massilia atriviolacea TaxID=2495579 RepID=A0A430HQR9_9BURK|nr:hypothetical protein [Massilia atriviolacea]RSZ59865.1 hypothetical protein EJB06_06680 [Massilia atriviolacea]